MPPLPEFNESLLTTENQDTGQVELKVIANGTEISMSEVISVSVVRQANKIPTAFLIFADGAMDENDFPLSSGEDLLPGREIEIRVGYNLEVETLFKGIVVKQGVRVKDGKPFTLNVECRDYAIKMTGNKRSRYFTDLTDSEVFDDILSNYTDLSSETEGTNTRHKELVQFRASDWDFIVSRAEANGMMVFVEDGTVRIEKPDMEQQAAHTVAWGRSIIEFDADLDARHCLDELESVGWSSDDQELVRETTSLPTIQEQGNTTTADHAEVARLGAYHHYHPGSLDPAELQEWSDAGLLKSRLSRIKGRARVQGDTLLKVGQTLRIEGIGERFNGTNLVTGLVHQIKGGGWTMDIAFGQSPDWITNQPDITDKPAAGLLPPVHGLQIGLVTHVGGDTLSGDYRVKVRIPYVASEDGSDSEGTWARLANVFAGNNRGTVFRPEVGDEVLLGFLNDDPRHPVVLGSFHSAFNAAPIPASDNNPEKGIYTKAEMKVVFNDEDKTVLISTKNGNSLLLSDKTGSEGITLEDQFSNKIVMSRTGIEIKADGSPAKQIIISSAGTVHINDP